jgi:hypothetical protein
MNAQSAPRACVSAGRRGHVGNTRMRLAGVRLQFWAVPFPDLRPAPEVGHGWVRFVQTAGGRPGTVASDEPAAC